MKRLFIMIVLTVVFIFPEVLHASDWPIEDNLSSVVFSLHIRGSRANLKTLELLKTDGYNSTIENQLGSFIYFVISKYTNKVKYQNLAEFHSENNKYRTPTTLWIIFEISYNIWPKRDSSGKILPGLEEYTGSYRIEFRRECTLTAIEDYSWWLIYHYNTGAKFPLTSDQNYNSISSLLADMEDFIGMDLDYELKKIEFVK